jgi:hypothetical protein
MTALILSAPRRESTLGYRGGYFAASREHEECLTRRREMFLNVPFEKL